MGPAAIARRIVREVEALTSPLDAELWASHLLGTMWERRTGLPLDEFDQYSLAYGQPVVEALAATEGPGARIALAAIAAVDDGELGLVARDLGDGLPWHESEPSWLPCVGETTITSAAVMREDVFDDGVTVFLEGRHATGETHAIGVYIDNNLGVMAKDILLADSIESVAEIVRHHPRDDGEVALVPLGPADAAAEISAAMELTDMTLDPPVTEDFAALRALAILRADETPGHAAPRGRPEISRAERDALRDEFLAAPEGRGFPADGDAAFAASLAIDFCADYVDGRPLRWSPVVIELFMAGWVPRKVLADANLFAALPEALDAWVRFAGRKRGIPDWAIKLTRDEIPGWRDEMTRVGNDPGDGGPAKQFLMAAQDAGVDLTDQQALTAFMAGWNARSTAV
jgi:hypothetical protein